MEQIVYDRRLLVECYVAGVPYHVSADDLLWDELMTGDAVALVREPDNTHDANAVAVALPCDPEMILGYLPRDCNADIAALMDMGWAELLQAELSEVDSEAPLNRRLQVEVYLRSREPRAPRYTGLRLQSVDRGELRDLGRRLSERGLALVRWTGKDLPETGEQVAMLYEYQGARAGYLMRVLASGDDCNIFLPVPEGGEGVPYVLTVVAGPAVMPANAALPVGQVYRVQEPPEPDAADAVSFFFKNLLTRL